MAARPTSIRIPEEIRRVIEETCRRTGRDFSSVASEMLAEAYREEIEQQLEEDAHWQPELLWATYPFTDPRRR